MLFFWRYIIFITYYACWTRDALSFRLFNWWVLLNNNDTTNNWKYKHCVRIKIIQALCVWKKLVNTPMAATIVSYSILNLFLESSFEKRLGEITIYYYNSNYNITLFCIYVIWVIITIVEYSYSFTISSQAQSMQTNTIIYHWQT